MDSGWYEKKGGLCHITDPEWWGVWDLAHQYADLL